MSADKTVTDFIATVQPLLQKIADDVAADTALDTQIASAIDQLIAGGSGELSAGVATALQTLSDQINASVQPQNDQVAALTAILAKVPTVPTPNARRA